MDKPCTGHLTVADVLADAVRGWVEGPTRQMVAREWPTCPGEAHAMAYAWARHYGASEAKARAIVLEMALG